MATKRKPYKSGERPKMGDLVWRYYANGLSIPEETENLVKDYGVVVGFWTTKSGNVVLPVITWSRTGKTYRNLTSSIRLAARSHDK